MRKLSTRHIGINIIFLVALSVPVLHGCGGSDAQAPQPAESTPSAKSLIASDVLLEVEVKLDDGHLKLVEAKVKHALTPSTPYPILAGDYGVFVVDREGKLQYGTMLVFSGSDKALGEGTDPATGKRFGVYIDLSSFPDSVTLPINADTEEIYVLDKDKKRVLDIPFDKSIFKSLPEKSSFFEKGLPLDQLRNLYQNIKFHQYNASWNIDYPLYEDTIAQHLIDGLARLRDRNILNGIRSIYVVSDPVDFWLTIEGVHLNHKLYLIEDFVLGNHLSELIAHEGAHAYIQLLEEKGFIPVAQAGDAFAGMSDIVFLYSSKWTEIKKEWYNLQQEYREKRSHSACGDAFVASKYEYGETLLPASSGKNPTVDNYFEHGFVSPYASADVGEDIAETFTLALFRADVFARKVKKGNIFDRKLVLLKGMDMLTASDYVQLTSAADVPQPSVVLMEFRHKGLQVKPLSFVLNGIDVSPSFFGSGEYVHEIGTAEIWIENGQNELAFATVKDTKGDDDDIEIEKLRLTSPLPIDPETGCDTTLVYLDAPEPIHLGNGNCPDDVFCSSYTVLRGTSYAWVF